MDQSLPVLRNRASPPERTRPCPRGIFVLGRGRQRTWITLLPPLLDTRAEGPAGRPRRGMLRRRRVAGEMDCFAAVPRARASSTVAMPPTGRRIIIGHPGAG